MRKDLLLEDKLWLEDLQNRIIEQIHSRVVGDGGYLITTDDVEDSFIGKDGYLMTAADFDENGYFISNSN